MGVAVGPTPVFAPMPAEEEVALRLSSMDDIDCAERVAGAVALIDGVRAVCVTLETQVVLVRFDAGQVSRWQFARAVSVMGCSVVEDAHDR
jgi:cation transport ATPase